MKKILIGLLMISGLSAFAQEAPKPKTGTNTNPDDKWMMSSFSVGISFQKFDHLNSRISNFPQYKQLKDQAAIITLGSLNQYKGFVSGMDLSLGSSMSGHRGKKSSSINFAGASLDFGYDVLPNKRILLYPFAGLEWEFYRAKYFKDNSGTDFDDVAGSSAIQNSIRPFFLNNNWFGWRVGLGVVVKAPNGKDAVGIKAGFTRSFTDRGWKSENNQTLGNSPSDYLQRGFVSLVFGRGGVSNHRM